MVEGKKLKKIELNNESTYHADDLNEIPVTGLKVNEKARIVRINTQDTVKLRKLAAFGILPDTDIIVIQKYPAYVVQVGFTQVALDSDIASEIIVYRG
ncbi:MAG: ferrous iron transport protein A [Clostridia bacterium]|nr:ferrous iron transport protein A [Clostridia bacterium]